MGAFELDLDTLFAPVPERIVYEDVLTFPAVLQDIAVAVAEDVEVEPWSMRRTRRRAPYWGGKRVRRSSRRAGR